ncbi:hypothetical protein SAMN05444724_0819 [Salinivibrio sp. ES.052]|nr:hypothetical protein SAMN05444724_0819 [Salinivibrio sp. ES.052]
MPLENDLLPFTLTGKKVSNPPPNLATFTDEKTLMSL